MFTDSEVLHMLDRIRRNRERTATLPVYELHIPKDHPEHAGSWILRIDGSEAIYRMLADLDDDDPRRLRAIIEGHEKP